MYTLTDADPKVCYNNYRGEKMDYIKQIINEELLKLDNELQPELDIEKRNMALAKLLESIGKGNSKSYRYEYLMSRERNITQLRKFIRIIKFECINNLKETYGLTIYQHTFTDIEKRKIYYTSELKNKSNREILILVLTEIVAALTRDYHWDYYSYSRQDNDELMYNKEVTDTVAGENSTINEIDRRTYAEVTYDRLSIILVGIGILPDIGNKSHKVPMRYFDVLSYYTDEPIMLPKMCYRKLNMYRRNQLKHTLMHPDNMLLIQWGAYISNTGLTGVWGEDHE